MKRNKDGTIAMVVRSALFVGAVIAFLSWFTVGIGTSLRFWHGDFWHRGENAGEVFLLLMLWPFGVWLVWNLLHEHIPSLSQRRVDRVDRRRAKLLKRLGVERD